MRIIDDGFPSRRSDLFSDCRGVVSIQNLKWVYFRDVSLDEFKFFLVFFMKKFVLVTFQWYLVMVYVQT